MPTNTIAQLKAHICDEPGDKGICVLIGKDVFQIRRIISSDEGVILACEPLAEEPPPVTSPSARARLDA